MNTVGKHVELFLVEGVAGGITTAEVVGWTGHVLTGVRANFSKKVVKRDEATRNGVYILIGDDPDATGGLKCYIGKTENFTDRFSNHLVNKDFWDRFVLISAKDAAFNEGHWSHLEHRLVDMAHKAKRAKVENSQQPQVRKLSEAAVSDVEAFIEQLQILLPVLGVNFFKSREAATDQEKKNLRPSLNFPPLVSEALRQNFAAVSLWFSKAHGVQRTGISPISLKLPLARMPDSRRSCRNLSTTAP